jgi:hypothetical protein
MHGMVSSYDMQYVLIVAWLGVFSILLHQQSCITPRDSGIILHLNIHPVIR